MSQFVVWRPEGQVERRFEWDPTRTPSPEAIAVEKCTGMTFVEWLDAISRGSYTAMQALLWMLRKRTEPTLTVDQVVFTLMEIDFEDDAEPVELEIAVPETEQGDPEAPKG